MIRRMIGISLTLAMAFAQKPPAFDAASVKPNLSGTGGFSMGTSHGRLTATNVPVRTLILKGFHAKEFQVTGGPGWLETERYDVVAKTENTSIGDNDLWLLLQPLLAERFKLRFHRETKQLPVYSLTVAKGGPKLKPHVGDDEPNMSGRTGSGKASFVGTKISMARLADMLGEHTDRIVLDNTGLKGFYDFKLDWAREDSHEPASISMLSSLQEGLGLTGPSLFTAVQEQLGLKLEPAKGPVEIIAIDSAEKASAN
jgi:uncharacterized protein (TIGR03435 family)